MSNSNRPSAERRAIVRPNVYTDKDLDRFLDRVRAYLPRNFTAEIEQDYVLVSGTDNAGWTLDGYVIPRLASGGMWGEEVSA